MVAIITPSDFTFLCPARYTIVAFARCALGGIALASPILCSSSLAHSVVPAAPTPACCKQLVLALSASMILRPMRRLGSRKAAYYSLHVAYVLCLAATPRLSVPLFDILMDGLLGELISGPINFALVFTGFCLLLSALAAVGFNIYRPYRHIFVLSSHSRLTPVTRGTHRFSTPAAYTAFVVLTAIVAGILIAHGLSCWLESTFFCSLDSEDVYLGVKCGAATGSILSGAHYVAVLRRAPEDGSRFLFAYLNTLLIGAVLGVGYVTALLENLAV